MKKSNNSTQIVRKYAIGVDLGGTKISIALVNKSGKVEQYLKTPTHAEQGREKIIARIKQGIEQVIKRRDFDIKKIAGIGIGVPGPVNHRKGIVHCAPNLPGWEEVPLVEIIKKDLHLPVKIENDANVAAWGEKIFGVARGIEEMVCLTLGTGIGGGLILCGKIYRGENNVAGEVGHITVNKDGPPCNCGKAGCLEAYSSAAGIKNRVHHRIEELKAGDKKFFSELNFEDISLAQIFELARQGNVIVRDIIEEAIEYLGIAIATLVNILNPEMIVLVGGITNEGENLLAPLKEIVFQRVMSSHQKELKIVFGELGEYAGAIGAAALFWDAHRSWL